MQRLPPVTLVSAANTLHNDRGQSSTRYHARVHIATHHATVVIGPVAGIDTLSLHYLLSTHIHPSRITIFMAHFEYLNTTWRSQNVSLGVNVRDVEDALTTRDRDAAMTRQSDYDILRYRTEEEAKRLYGNRWWPRVSNTEMNEKRRKGIVSQAHISEEKERIETSSEGNKENGAKRTLGHLLQKLLLR